VSIQTIGVDLKQELLTRRSRKFYWKRNSKSYSWRTNHQKACCKLQKERKALTSTMFESNIRCDHVRLCAFSFSQTLLRTYLKARQTCLSKSIESKGDLESIRVSRAKPLRSLLAEPKHWDFRKMNISLIWSNWENRSQSKKPLKRNGFSNYWSRSYSIYWVGWKQKFNSDL